MNVERLKKLEKFLESDPEDPFLLYAIAIEWISEDPEKTWSYFERLMTDHPDYIGTYFHAAKLQVSFGNRTDAEEIFKKGIEVAQNNNDVHSLRELKSAYNEFLYENNDD